MLELEGKDQREQRMQGIEKASSRRWKLKIKRLVLSFVHGRYWLSWAVAGSAFSAQKSSVTGSPAFTMAEAGFRRISFALAMKVDGEGRQGGNRRLWRMYVPLMAV